MSTIHVCANDHADGSTGAYFHFDRCDLPGLLEDYDGDMCVTALHSRTGETIDLRVWAHPNGGSCGNAHGRAEPCGEEGMFEVGDQLLTVVKVTCIAHANGDDGQYFHFSKTDYPQLFDCDDIVSQLWHSRTGEKRTVRMWGHPNGGNGTAHGRCENPSPGDWEEGDLMFQVPCINVLDVHHAHGDDAYGHYFHFNKSDVPGFEEGEALQCDIVNTRNGEEYPVVMWGNPNGGWFGNAHGRQEPFGECATFCAGDQLRLNNAIRVLSINHAHGDDYLGHYFHFDIDDLNGEVEEGGSKQLSVKLARTGQYFNVVIFGNPNGGSFGNAHGRIEPFDEGGMRWHAGDIFTFEDCC